MTKRLLLAISISLTLANAGCANNRAALEQKCAQGDQAACQDVNRTPLEGNPGPAPLPLPPEGVNPHPGIGH